MSADKLEGQLDKMLEQVLQAHTEPVPADFTERVLRQIREAEEQRILARVVLQERLALAGCIVSGIVVIAVAAVLLSVAGGLAGQVGAFVGRIRQVIEAVSYDWQFYTIFVGVLVFAAYSLVDLLVGDS